MTHLDLQGYVGVASATFCDEDACTTMVYFSSYTDKLLLSTRTQTQTYPCKYDDPWWRNGARVYPGFKARRLAAVLYV